MSKEDELLEMIAQAGARMEPELTEKDVDRLVTGALERRRKQVVRSRALIGSAALGVVVGLVALSRHSGHLPTASESKESQEAENAPSRSSPLNVIRLVDGSTVTALDSSTEVAVIKDGDATWVSLGRGRGRFSVTPRLARPFVVHAGDVTVAVLGTSFTVERVADRVGVSVEHGTVRVEWKGGDEVLKAGDNGWYPPLPTVEPQVRKAGAMTKSPATTSKGAAHALVAGESAESLLAAADKARLSGHPSEGAELLRRILLEHHRDPRAALAAFTLGRMLLIQLAQPREAAAAFAEARRLSPQGPLAEDALAREFQALGQAGEWSLAAARARDYLRLYPEGRRAGAAHSMVGQ
jgi:transmembrane sensor